MATQRLQGAAHHVGSVSTGHLRPSEVRVPYWRVSDPLFWPTNEEYHGCGGSGAGPLVPKVLLSWNGSDLWDHHSNPEAKAFYSARWLQLAEDEDVAFPVKSPSLNRHAHRVHGLPEADGDSDEEL